MIDCLISFGSNLGDSEQIVSKALKQVENRVCEQQAGPIRFRSSRYFVTRPIGGPGEQEAFLNGVARFSCTLIPDEILTILLETEKEFGRLRRTRWDARTLDLDLLLYGSSILHEPGCQVPHPRMCFRQFVLQPAMEIAADMIHPICGVTIATLLKRITEREKAVLFLVSRENLELMNQVILSHSWSAEIQVVCHADVESLCAGMPEHKLLVWAGSDGSPAQFVNRCKDLLVWHNGPVLIMGDEESGGTAEMGTVGISRVETELSAAIETMKAI